MNLLDLVPLWAKLAILAAIAAAATAAGAWFVHYERGIGRAEVQVQCDADKAAQAQADLKQAGINAAETARRLKLQKENDDANAKQLADARAAAARNARDADQLREQNASVAKQWRDALRDSPTVSQCAAAGDAIAVQADVLGRADHAASLLAETADAARAAGLKCERDYDALTQP